MRLDGGAVDHRKRGRVAVFDERVKYGLPQAALAPAIVSVEDRRIWPVFVGKRTPSTALAQPMDDAADDAPIVLAFRSSMNHREMRRDRRPLLVTEPENIRHESSPPPQRLESRGDPRFNQVQALILDRHELGGVDGRQRDRSLAIPLHPKPGEVFAVGNDGLVLQGP